uniref:Uncharacterized protein n=1 Tax=Anguilla anguilla TaxID=7936 RepID=A0A0E9SIN0_ANGAN
MSHRIYSGETCHLTRSNESDSARLMFST